MGFKKISMELVGESKDKTPKVKMVGSMKVLAGTTTAFVSLSLNSRR